MPCFSSILGLSYFEERLSFEKELILQSLHVNLTLDPFNCFPPGVLEASFVSRAEQRLLQAPFNSVKITVHLDLHTNIFGPTLGILLVTFCVLSYTLASPIKRCTGQSSTMSQLVQKTLCVLDVVGFLELSLDLLKFVLKNCM